MTVDVTHPTTTTDRFDRACTMAYDSVKMLAAMAGTIGMVCVGDRFIHSTPDMPDLDNLWDILVVGIPAHVFMVAAFFGSMQLANNIVVILFTTSLTTASRKIVPIIAAFGFARAVSEPSGGIFGIFPTPYFMAGMSSVRVAQALYLRDVLAYTAYGLGCFVLALTVALILYVVGASKILAFRARRGSLQRDDVKVDVEAPTVSAEK